MTLDPVDIEFKELSVRLQTKLYFEEGSSAVKIERLILEMSDPEAQLELNEYMTACYGTTEYPEDMTGIVLRCEGKGSEDKQINYEYKCREKVLFGARCVSAVIPQICTRVSLIPAEQAEGYVREGYAFSPMFTLGYRKRMKEKEVFATWLKLERED